MTERGIVKKIKRDLVYVELSRGEKCEGCKACAFGRDGKIVLPALCELNELHAGDSVSVQMPERECSAAALLIYALPLLGLLIGALAGLAGEWWLQLILAGAGLILGLISVIPIERVYRKRSGAFAIVKELITPKETQKECNE